MPPSDPSLVVQLDDAAVADAQLVLDGVALPFARLGGSVDASVDGAPAPGGAVTLTRPAGWSPDVPLDLADRELTPFARLSPMEATEAEVAGRLTPLRARESRLFADRALRPADEPDPQSPRHVLVASRPLLTADIERLAALPGEVLILVPVETASPDGVPPTTLMRSVQHAAHTLEHAKVVATSLFWRDPATNAALVETLASAYHASSHELLEAGGDWAAMLTALQAGAELPSVADERVLAELRRWRPEPSRRGLLVLFTGLSGSGKSTLARDLVTHVNERTPRTVSLLDGDDVRRLLSSGLGFDRAARDLNVRRIGYVGSEIARHGGLAVCAPIAPYAESRAAVRAMVAPVGDFVLVHVSTPLEECERRDLKGLYAKARAGLIPEFTGISDPYDVPTDADLAVDTSAMTRDEALTRVLELLRAGGWLTDDE